MPELPLDRFDVAAELVPAGFGMARAVVEGRGRGRVWVDDSDAPSRVLVATVEVWLLAGPPGHEAFERELREVLAAATQPGGTLAADDEELVITCRPAAWEPRLEAVFGGRDLLSDPRRYLELDVAALRSQPVPPDYERVEVDAAFLDAASEGPADEIRGWVDSHFRDRGDFLERAGATVLMQAGVPAAWCVTDNRSGEVAEVGIETAPEHRRRGLASAAAAATIERLAAKGVRRVGWHCYARNEASVRTATRLGFEPSFDYLARFRMFDPLRHELVRAWCRYELEDDPGGALALLHPLLEANEGIEGPWFALAARAAARSGELDAVFGYLGQALERDWDGLDALAAEPEFETARADPRWAELSRSS